MGLLVGQDFLFACAAYPEEEPFATEVAAEARDNVTRLVAYYVLGHVSKFVPSGSVRIDSNAPSAGGDTDTLPNVAFQTPDRKTVLIVANTGDASQNFAVRYKGKAFTTSLGAGSVGTYLW